MDAERFSLETAVRAGRDGDLARWVGEFLASPGSDNAPLAARLASRPWSWLGPVRTPIDRLVPLAGPEDADDRPNGDRVICPVEDDEWEDDVAQMRESLADGWEPPPLLAEYRDGELLLQDGNHRHESLRRAGQTHAWVVVWFDTEAERDRFAATLGPDDLAADRPVA